MRLFALDAPLARTLNRVTDLVVLNLLTIAVSVPVVTAGAALTALHASTMRLLRGEEGNLVSEYFRFFKRDFKKATLLWLLFLAGVCLLAADVILAAAQESTFFKALTVLAFAGLFVLAMIFQYLFPLTARFENGIMATVRNAFALSVMAFPRTLLMIVTDAVPVLLLLLLGFHFMPVVILLGASGPVYVKTLLYRSVFTRMEQADGENT